MKSKQFSKAETQYKKVLQIHETYWKGFFSPALATSKLHLGHVYDLMGNRKEALHYYKQVINESIIKPGEKSKAEEYLKKKFELPKPFTMSPDELKMYQGTYQMEEDSYEGYIGDDGILEIKGTNGMKFKLVPFKKDKFAMVGNDDISVEYIRDSKNKLVGTNVFRNGQLMLKLNKTK